MIFYSFTEICLLICAAIIVDLIIGDPKWPTHPVIWIGRWITLLTKVLHPQEPITVNRSPKRQFMNGLLLALSTLLMSTLIMLAILAVAKLIHPWLAYVVTVWFISTTIAIKGLKDAAMLVYTPLIAGNLAEARKYIGYIVSRDQEVMGEQEITRATVETVAENIVDAVVSPIFWALIGGAPLAMLYRASNTLDSMVGYRNQRFEYYGKASARLDDILNYIPARITGVIVVLIAFTRPTFDGVRSMRAIFTFASKHPSPNSGIPESAVAGALRIELGGLNRYFGQWQERAKLGWPIESLQAKHIKECVHILYGVSIFIWIGGVLGCLMSIVIK